MSEAKAWKDYRELNNGWLNMLTAETVNEVKRLFMKSEEVNQFNDGELGFIRSVVDFFRDELTSPNEFGGMQDEAIAGLRPGSLQYRLATKVSEKIERLRE